MKKISCLLLAGAVSLSLLAGCGGNAAVTAAAEETAAPSETAEPEAAEAPVEKIEGTLSLGDRVPNFTVTLADGTVFTLSEALETHKLVMVNIWAGWCVPCCREMPTIQEAYEEYKDDVALVCLSAYDDNDAIAAFEKENGLDLPLGYDSVGMTNALATESYPTTIIIDRFGNYAFCECGAVTDTAKFGRMWDPFLGDDYTETLIMEEVPGPRYAGEYPTNGELSRALCPDGSLSFTCDCDDECDWPYVVTESGVVNSNAMQSDTCARLSTTVTAKAGDVFAVDYSADLAVMYDSLFLLVNDEPVKAITGTSAGTWAYEFPADGDYEIDFQYTENLNASQTDTSGTIELSDARVLSGDDAAAVLDAQPVYPYALEGDDCGVEVLTEGAKRVVLAMPEGTDEMTADMYSSLLLYVVPGDSAEFRLLLGNACDAEMAVEVDTVSSAYRLLSQMEQDDRGYLGKTDISCMEEDGIGYTQVQTAGSFLTLDVKNVFFFKNEENVNYFVQNMITDGTGSVIEGVKWTYEDGTSPSSAALPNA